MSYINEYYELIKSGSIIVGKELKLQLEELIKEINDPVLKLKNNIKIDFDKSNTRIKFIEKECKHFEAPHAGKPFKLEIWQKAFIEAIFAIHIWDSELNKYVRKYQEIIFLVGRKNGKTPLVSAVTLSEWFCGEMGKKCLCASNNYDQADLMYMAIDSMREESPTLEKYTRRTNKGIFFGNRKQKNKKGKFSAQNKGSIRKLSGKSKAKEGRNIALGAVDEVFEMLDDSTVMPIRQALSTQDEPLYFELTTEGFVNDGYLDKRLIEARKVLNKELERPRWLIWLYTQDNELEIWQDEKTWVKSNPGLGVIKKWSFLRKMIEESKMSTSKRAYVLAKDFNVKQNAAAAWLQDEEIKTNLTYNIEDLRNTIAVGAVDLSETTDLTSAKALIMRPGSHIKYYVSMYFITESKIQTLTKTEKERYINWAKEGYLIICQGNEVDYGEVVNWFIMLYKKYNIRFLKIGYDRWNAKSFVKEMEEIGFDLEKITQDIYTLSPGMKLLEADLKSNYVNYNNNPIDIWCLQNTACKTDDAGRIMPVKIKDIKLRHIDGTITKIICNVTLDRNKKEYMELIR